MSPAAAAAALVLGWASASGLPRLPPSVPTEARLDVEPGRKTLLEAAAAAFQAAEKVAATALEPERAPQLKAGVDRAAALAKTAALSGRDLAVRGQAALAEAELLLKGRPSRDGLEKKLAAAEKEAAPALGLRARLGAEAKKLKERLDKLPKKPRDLEGLLAESLRALVDADSALEASPRGLAGMRAAKLQMEAALRKASDSLDALLKAMEILDRAVAVLDKAAPPAKAGLDGLPNEPRNHSRSMAIQRLQPFIDGARAFYPAADSAANRAEEHQEAHRAVLLPYARFEEERAAAGQAAREAAMPLGRAEELLKRLRAGLDELERAPQRRP